MAEQKDGSSEGPNLGVSRKLLIFLVSALVLIIGITLLFVSKAFSLQPPWSWLTDAIGGFLAISVATSFVYSATLRRLDDGQRKEELQRLFDQEIAAQRKEELERLFDENLGRLIKGYAHYGIDEFCAELSFKRLFDELQEGDELWWLDTFSPDHKAWVGHLRSAIRRGANIKMLAIEPSSANAKFRAQEISEVAGFDEQTNFEEAAASFLRDISRYAGGTPEEGRLELRKYSDLPCIPMYIVCRDSKPLYGYTSFFLSAPTGVEFPHIRWRAGQHSFLDLFFTYVKQKWERNRASQE